MQATLAVRTVCGFRRLDNPVGLRYPTQQLIEYFGHKTMTVTIELRPEIEAALASLAAELTPAERARAWRDAVRGLPHTKPVSGEAISRESLYIARG